MKILIILAVAVSVAAGATNFNPGNSESDSKSQAASNSKSHAVSDSASNAAGGNATGGSITDQSVVTLLNEYGAVASTAAQLILPECTEGGSMQTKDGGISMAKMNFICASVMLMRVQLESAQGEIDAAKACKDDSAQQRKHLSAAHEYLDNAKGINKRALGYHEDISKTAPWGAWASDLWAWIVATVGILVIL